MKPGDCESVVTENGAQLTHDVRLIFPVVLDQHSCEVWSAGNIMGREWRKSVTKSHVHFANTTHSIHLDFKTNGRKKYSSIKFGGKNSE